MKWPSNNSRSIIFLFKYKMNYINYIIKTAVKLKECDYINIVKTYIFIMLLL